MVDDAERYKDEDARQRDRIHSKNQLESYVYHLKQSLDDQNIASKISSSDKSVIMSKVEETIDWLDSNQVYDDRYRSVFIINILNSISPVFTHFKRRSFAERPFRKDPDVC